MLTIDISSLSGGFNEILDRVEFGGETVAIVRDGREIARITLCPPGMTAMEAFSDLYRTLPEDAAKDWLADSRVPGNIGDQLKI